MIQRNLLRRSRQFLPRATQSRTLVVPSSASASAVSQSRAQLSPLWQQQRLLSSRLPAPTRARILSRWYSQDPKPAQESDESLGEGVKGEEANAAADGGNPLQKELDAKNKEVVELKDKYLRQVAEFRNLQERTKRDVQSTRDFAIQRFAKDLIESIDTFDLALSAVPSEKLVEPSSNASAETDESSDPNKELRQLHSGLRMTETVLLNTLKKHGLERFDPAETGDRFDPNIHEATFQTPQPDKEDGTVFYTTQKGFILNGRVLRAAKVGVVKNS